MKALERSIGLVSVVAITIGAMLSNLFVLPGLAIPLTGSSMWAAFFVAGISIFPAALSKAELGTAMPVSGGTYVYIDRTFGPLAGTVMGLGLWLALLLKSAFALVGFSAYLSVLIEIPQKPVALILLAVVFGLNVLGIRKVGKVQLGIVVIAMIALVILFVWGAVGFDAALLEPSFTQGGMGFISAVAFLYVGFAGVTKIAAISEEVKDPKRNLPLGILISLVIIISLFGGVSLILVGNIPAEQLSGDLRSIHTLAAFLGGEIVGKVVAVIGGLTMLSMANSGLLSASRFPFAMSRDSLLPKTLSRVHSRFMTPIVAIIVSTVVIGLAVAFLEVERIAKLASSLKIVAFMAVNLAVVVLRESGTQWYRPTFRVPVYPLVQIFGILSGVILLMFLGVSGILALTAICVPGVVLFVTYGRKRTDRSGVFGRLGPRREIAAEASRLSGKFHISQLPLGASVVVPLLGRERSPETLVEFGAALADGKRIKVLQLTNVPEQLMIDAVVDDNTAETSLKRRIDALAQDQSLMMEFDSVATRDVVKTVHEVTTKVHCQWLVMEGRRAEERRWLFFNQLSWLINHLSCNLAIFNDAGVRYIREILVLTAPGPHDALVIDTADHLAQIYQAKITFVRFVPDNALPIVIQTETDYLDQLCQLSVHQPQRLTVRGSDLVTAIAAKTGAYDLLIMGALGASRLRDYLVGSPEDRLTRAASCSVLRVKTPPGTTHKPRNIPAPEKALRITSLLKEDRLQARLPSMRKDALFSHVAEVFGEIVPKVTTKEIEEALWIRERSQNTALGNGIAVPHATLAAADQQYLGVFVMSEPIDYQTADKQPVDVFFVTLGPASERYNHLRLLATISKLVTQTDLLGSLRSAADAGEMLGLFRSCEAELGLTTK